MKLKPSMKTPLTLLGLTLLAAADAALAAGPTIPQRPPPDTFQKLTEDWPFALATPAAPVAGPVAPPWSDNYFVGGIGKTYESGKEEIFVAIRLRDGQAGFSLFGNQPNGEDISVSAIEMAEKLVDSKVTLKKGAEFATVKFDQAAITQPAPQTAPVLGRPGMPNVPGMKGQPIIRPPGAPGIVPRPTTIPLPSAASMPSNTNAAPASPANPAPNAPRQRVRVIQSTP